MKVHVIISLMCLFFMSFSSFGQEVNRYPAREGIGCHATEMNREMKKSVPPGYQGRGTAIMQRAKASEKASAGNGGKYIIPVVFHVFGKEFNNGTTVTEAIVKEALEKTNLAFQGLAADWATVTPPFNMIKTPLNIEFRLVQKDAKGNPTTGILYYDNRAGFGNADAATNAAVKQFAWDNYMYMNVYIMRDLKADGKYNNSGVGWYPDEWMSDNGLARVVYNGSYLHANAKVTENENFGRILTHEFGHWLNLIHTFEGGCTYPNDEVMDTPPHEKTFMAENELNCEGKKTNWQNFMNYTDAYINFTAEQVQRMKRALDGHPTRFPLWQEENLKKVFFLGDETLVEVTKRSIFEDKKNDGSFSDRFELTLLYGEANGTVDSYLAESDYVATGLPEGLTVKVKIAEKSKLQVEVVGKAQAHSSSNNTTFKLTLGKGICNKPMNTQGDVLELLFRNPYTIVYTDCADVKIDATHRTETFQVSSSYPVSRYELVFDATTRKLRVNTFGKYLATEGLSRNVKLLEPGTLVSADLQWLNGTAEYLHDIYTSSYKVWAGETAYLGFWFEGGDKTERLYGWMRFSVSATGDAFTLLDYAFNEAPNEPILAGRKSENPVELTVEISADKTSIKEGDAVVFSAEITTENSIVGYLWSLTGGAPATSEEASPEVVYALAGVYPVSLQVTDMEGNTETVTVEQMIRVEKLSVTESNKLDVVNLIVLNGAGEKLFRIGNIDRYTDTELIFFNRWGKMLYQRKNYGNDLSLASWEPGTYYYVFSYREDGKKREKKSFVEVVAR